MGRKQEDLPGGNILVQMRGYVVVDYNGSG